MAAGVVEALERVEVEHQERERAALGGRRDIPELALERAMVAQPGERVVLGPNGHRAVDLGILEGQRRLAGEQLDELELVLAEVGLLAAHPSDVERADDLAGNADRDDDHRLRLGRRARDLDRARIAEGIVGEDPFAIGDDPAADPDLDRPGVVEDHLGEAVASDDCPPDARLEVAAIDRERVVRHDRLQGVGDHLEDALRVAGRDQALVDLEQPALAGDLMLELAALAVELVELGRVDDRLGGIAGKDRQGRLVLASESVAPDRRQDDDRVDVVLEADRNREKGLGGDRQEATQRARVARPVADEDGRVVGGRPAGQPLADRTAEHGRVRRARAAEHAPERDGFAPAGVVIDPIDADRVVVDQPLGALDDQLGHLGKVAGPVEPDRQVLDRLEPGGQGAHRLVEPGVAHRGRHLVGQAASEGGLLAGPGTGRVLVEDEQPDGLVSEDHRSEARAPDPVPGVEIADVIGRRVDQGVGEGHDVAGPDRAEPGGRRVRGQGRDPGEDLVRHPVLSGEAERVTTLGVVQPQPDPRQREEVNRVRDRVAEQGLEIDLAAHLGRKAAQRVGTGLRIPDQSHPFPIGPASSEPGVEIGAPDAWLVARPGDRRQAPAQAPRPGRGPGDPGGRGDVAEAQECVFIGWLECDGHLPGR